MFRKPSNKKGIIDLQKLKTTLTGKKHFEIPDDPDNRDAQLDNLYSLTYNVISAWPKSTKGSHRMYKRTDDPRHLIPFQPDKHDAKMAKGYQVKQLISFIEEHDLQFLLED